VAASDGTLRMRYSHYFIRFCACMCAAAAMALRSIEPSGGGAVITTTTTTVIESSVKIFKYSKLLFNLNIYNAQYNIIF